MGANVCPNKIRSIFTSMVKGVPIKFWFTYTLIAQFYHKRVINTQILPLISIWKSHFENG